MKLAQLGRSLRLNPDQGESKSETQSPGESKTISEPVLLSASTLNQTLGTIFWNHVKEYIKKLPQRYLQHEWASRLQQYLKRNYNKRWVADNPIPYERMRVNCNRFLSESSLSVLFSRSGFWNLISEASELSDSELDDDDFSDVSDSVNVHQLHRWQ
jgi:hypothetical protein